MANYKPLGVPFDRTFRNDLNENFSTIDAVAADAKVKATKAESDASMAVVDSSSAKTIAESVQAQFNQVVIEGDSSVEAAQARVAADKTFVTLKERLDNRDVQLAEISTNVKKFGAKGDGITDDAPAIQAAIDFLESAGGGSLFFPYGTYKVNRQIELPAKRIQYYGCGWNTYIKAGTAMESIFHKGLGVTSGSVIKDIEFDANKLANNCIWLEQANSWKIHDVHLKHFLVSGLKSNTTEPSLSGAIQYETMFYHSKITGLENGNPSENRPNYGLYLGRGATDGNFHDLTIRNVKIAHVYAEGGNNRFARVHCFGFPEPDFNAQYGFQLIGGSVYLNQCFFDGVPIGVKAQGGTFQIVNSVFFWRFDAAHDKSGYSGIEINSGVTNYIITNNLFNGAVGYDIKYLGAKSGMVFNNNSISVMNQAGFHIFNGKSVEFGKDATVNETLTTKTLSVGTGGINSTGGVTSAGKGEFKNGLKVIQTDSSNIMTHEMFGKDSGKYVSFIMGTVDKKRWEIQKNITTEDLLIVAYDDNGAQIGNAIRINRSNLDITVASDIRFNSSGKGPVLTSPDGSKWRQTIGNTGTTTWTKI